MIQTPISRIRNPAAIGGAVGLLAGFVTAAALIAAGEPWYARGDEAMYVIVYWLDFPVASQIQRFTGWGWAPDEHRALVLVGTTLNGLFWGAAGTAFVRRFRRSARLRKTLRWAVAIEIPLILALHLTGIPSPFAGPNIPASAATGAHAPAFFLLTQLGLCCGYVNHFIVSDFWGGAVQHPHTAAMLFLLASNVVMFTLLAYAFRELWKRMTRRRDRARAAAPVAPG